MFNNEQNWLSKLLRSCYQSAICIITGEPVSSFPVRQSNKHKFNCPTRHWSHNLYTTLSVSITYQFTYNYGALVEVKKLANSPSFILASAEISHAKHAGQNTLIHIVVHSGYSRELGR